MFLFPFLKFRKYLLCDLLPVIAVKFLTKDKIVLKSVYKIDT